MKQLVPSPLAGILLFALGALAGALGSAWTGRAPRPVAEEARALVPTRDPSELDAALAALREARLELERAVERVASAPAAARRPAPPPAPDGGEAAEPAELLARLERALASLPGGGRALHHPDLPPREPPDFEALRGLYRAGDPASFDRSQQDFRSRHLLWTYQDALSVYGPPDELSGGGGDVFWRYERDLGGGERELFELRFADGYVYETHYEIYGG